MSKAAQAAREVAASYRRRWAAAADPVRSMVLEVVEEALSDFAAALEYLEKDE